MKLLLFGLIYLGSTVASTRYSLSSHKRIANGVSSPDGEYPFVTSYQHVINGHFCACVILTNVWLLTAAHCVIFARQYALSEVQIVAGITNLISSSTSRQVRKVLRQYSHPRFPGGTKPNDIGLVRVSYPFDPSASINSIRLPEYAQEFYGVVEIVGWGYRRSTYPAITPDLQMAQTSIISTNQCNSIVSQYATVDNSQICVVGYRLGNETTCNGDSGGPLIAYLQDVPHCVGIMSWNLSPCGMRGTPSVAAKVSWYTPWISCRIYFDATNPTAVC